MHRKNNVGRALLPVLLITLAISSHASPLVVPAERFPNDAGLHLYRELGCGNCHEHASNSAPSLLDLPKRVNHDWLLAFLKDPEHKRMPALFDNIPDAERDQSVRDVAAYLSTLKGDLKNFPQQRHANAERGSALYHEIGCVACHAPTPDFRPKRPASPLAIPLPNLKKKTSLMALTDFLLHTEKYRPNPRKPQIPLDQQEALDIAAHLLDFQSSDPREADAVKPWPKATADMIERGKTHVTNLNCASCHKVPGMEAAPKKVIKNPDANCKTAHYDLSDNQKQSLASYLKRDKNALSLSRSLTEITELAQFNCYACHSRNGHGGPLPNANPFFIGDESLGDSGRLPPPLAGAGLKLKPEVIKSVLLGEPHSRVRPYLKTRMPIYSALYAEYFAKFSFQWDLPREGLDPELPEIAQVEDLEAGRKLLGTNGGVNCITCHRWGDQPSLGIQGPDISDLDKRLNSDWFRHYLLNPAAYRPGTLMPALWPDGHASVKDILDGDTEKQIGAIWAFIRDGTGLPEGYPNKSTTTFELTPTDRPIIQRTFLEGIGTHAILVGFPGGINLAYDGKTAQPALLWRGRFFDAYSTWFSRFAPFEKPLEDKTYAFPKSESNARFLGYETDTDGNPTFLSKIDGRTIRDTWKVSGEKLVRTRNAHSPVVAPSGTLTTAVKDGENTVFTYQVKAKGLNHRSLGQRPRFPISNESKP